MRYSVLAFRVLELRWEEDCSRYLLAYQRAWACARDQSLLRDLNHVRLEPSDLPGNDVLGF